MLNLEIIECATRCVLCWLATSDLDGVPNVSPKEIFTIYGNSQILIANIASPTSVRNINSNAHVCVCFVDVFVQKGFKLKGRARNIEPSNSDFQHLLKPLEAKTAGKFKIHSIILMDVDTAEPVLAPSYLFHGHEVNEATQVASAMRTYGVSPL